MALSASKTFVRRVPVEIVSATVVATDGAWVACSAASWTSSSGAGDGALHVLQGRTDEHV